MIYIYLTKKQGPSSADSISPFSASMFMRQIASEPVWNGILFANVLESTRETLYLEDTAIIEEEEIVGFVFRKLGPKVYPNLIPRWSRTNVERRGRLNSVVCASIEQKCSFIAIRSDGGILMKLLSGINRF